MLGKLQENERELFRTRLNVPDAKNAEPAQQSNQSSDT